MINCDPAALSELSFMCRTVENNLVIHGHALYVLIPNTILSHPKVAFNPINIIHFCRIMLSIHGGWLFANNFFGEHLFAGAIGYTCN